MIKAILTVVSLLAMAGGSIGAGFSALVFSGLKPEGFGLLEASGIGALAMAAMAAAMAYLARAE